MAGNVTGSATGNEMAAIKKHSDIIIGDGSGTGGWGLGGHTSQRTLDT